VSISNRLYKTEKGGAEITLLSSAGGDEGLHLGEGDGGLNLSLEELREEEANVETDFLAVHEGSASKVVIEGVEEVERGDVEVLLGACGEEGGVLSEEVVADAVREGEDSVEEPGDGLGACGELLDEEGVLAGGVLVGDLDDEVVQLDEEAG
jgi:hypothetical protein